MNASGTDLRLQGLRLRLEGTAGWAVREAIGELTPPCRTERPAREPDWTVRADPTPAHPDDRLWQACPVLTLRPGGPALCVASHTGGRLRLLGCHRPGARTVSVEVDPARRTTHLGVPDEDESARWWSCRLAKTFFARADFGGVMRYTEIVPIVVPADPAKNQGRRNRSVGPDAELWLWNRPPTGAVHTWRPDRVLFFDQGTVVELTAETAADRRPRPAPPEAPYTPWQTVRHGNLELTWYAADPPLLVRDHTSREPAVRVTAAGTTPLPDSERGLIVFASHLGDRPPLSRIRELAPGYAPLATEPAPRARRFRSGT